MVRKRKYKHRCEKNVYDSGSMLPRPCEREGVVQEHGSWFCKHHTRAAIIARREKSSAKWTQEYKARQAAEQKRQAAEELSRRKLELFDELVRELTHLVRLLEPLEKEGGLQVPGLATLNGARAVLSKVDSLKEQA
jgi:hypothetical protein